MVLENVPYNTLKSDFLTQEMGSSEEHEIAAQGYFSYTSKYYWCYYCKTIVATNNSITPAATTTGNVTA